jgi:hypothetical protein
MKHRAVLALALVLSAAAALPGCRSVGPSAATGAAVGGLLGAGGGYAIGHHRGNRTNHALALGAGGALAGYLIGDLIDHRAAESPGPSGPTSVVVSEPAPPPVIRYVPAPQRVYVVRERVVSSCCHTHGW